jgi:uncharacterized membrane protein
MMPLAITLHVLSVLIWVGGMFFAYMALRPAATALEPSQRLPLWSRTFARFFPWVWAAVILLPLTGYWMILYAFDGFANAKLYIHLMQGVGLVMIGIFFYVFFIPYARLKRAVIDSDWPSGGQALAEIRRWVGINLILGIITTVVATAGAYLS